MLGKHQALYMSSVRSNPAFDISRQHEGVTVFPSANALLAR